MSLLKIFFEVTVITISKSKDMAPTYNEKGWGCLCKPIYSYLQNDFVKSSVCQRCPNYEMDMECFL